MAEPSRLLGQTTTHNNVEDSDIDAEGESDDMEYDQVVGVASVAGNTTDAEGEEIDDDEDGEPVGAVKLAVRKDATSSEEEEGDVQDGDATEESESDAKTSDSEASSGSESEAENEWQAENDESEEGEAEVADPNTCTYCGEDEENDPSPEYEEFLTCRKCGDNAHRQCARNAKTLSPDDGESLYSCGCQDIANERELIGHIDAKRWRCTVCLQKALEDEEGERHSPETSASRRRLSSVPKLARDLLPSHRGQHPGGHSMFNDLIIPDDPLDGSRSLRKRKPSHEEEHAAARVMRKKRKSSEASKSEIELDAASSPRAVRIAVSEAVESDDARASATEHESSRGLRSTRTRRPLPKRTDKRPLVWLEESAGASLIVVFHLNNEKVQKIMSMKPKKNRERARERDRNRDRSRRAQQIRPVSPEVSHYPSIQPHFTAPFYGGLVEKEMDETKNKPYGGILSEADADTSKTYPTQADRNRFESARLKAEDDWKKKQLALYGAQENTREKKVTGPPSKIKCISFGGWEIDTWHAAPYPEEYSRNKVLYICEFCLKYMNSDYVAWRHKLKCPAKHPPGDEIYRDGKYSFFEVDGRKNPVYCQNLCLLAKLFLGSKTLYYDVEPFLFYVMTENDNYGCHFVGYFSKEKRPSSLNNVSCILVLPIHQRKGYGQYLIEFSYLLTRYEKKTGSPEKPLSDMGLVSYRKYWRLIMCQELLNQRGPISITTISERTGMTPDDIVSALEGLRALVRDPVSKAYALRLDYKYFKEYIEKANKADHPRIKSECLIWTPYVMGRISSYEDGPALHTVQPREELDDEDKPAPEEGVQMTEAAKTNGTGASKDASIAAGEEGEPGTPALPDEFIASPGPPTPLANGSTPALSLSQPNSLPSIPPSRFEVFPPIPGMPATKRRPGRPFGSRRRTGTPQRNRNLTQSLSISTAPISKTIQVSPSRSGRASPTTNGALTPSGSINVRRTRSKLGETVVNGFNDEENEEGELKVVNGTRSGTRSASKTPRHHSRISRGKLRVVEPDEDEDAEGEDDDDEINVNGTGVADEDMDAEGEDDDIDAEGEDDDEDMDVDMVGV